MHRLAYEDGGLVVRLSRAAFIYTNDMIVSGYIPKHIPLNVKEIISLHFDDTRRFDEYVENYVFTKSRMGDYTGCTLFADFKWQSLEFGSGPNNGSGCTVSSRS